MAKVVQLSNDVASGFYLDGTLICQCGPDELDVIFRALGFDFEFQEDFKIDEFPEKLKEEVILIWDFTI